MADIVGAIKELGKAARMSGFGQPVVRFPTWEDGAVLLVYERLPMPDEAEAVDGLHVIVIGGVRIEFPTKAKRGE